MSEPHDPLLGRLVAGRYRIIEPLGEGGMGKVYLAEHEAIEKQVALKVLRPEFSRKEDIVTRFQQEAISASRIKHPNVLDVFDFGRLESGEAFLAMEFLDGHDLSDELAKVGSLEPVRGLHIALQICRALAAAHARGVVHRDMKPDNVFLQRTGDGDEIVKIVDFGIAQLRTNEEAAKSQPTRRRLTKTGMIFGTPEYMAPEQAAGKNTDQRVDVYAVAVMLYEMFTGTVPFTGDSFMAVLNAAISDPPPPMRRQNADLRIGVELEEVIMRGLAKKPDERYGSMGEFATAIIATPEGSLLARPGHGGPETRWSSFPVPAGSPTAAQFEPPTAPAGMLPTLAAHSEPTFALGTPLGAAAGKSSVAGQSSTVVPSGGANRALLMSSVAVVLAGLAAGAYFLGGSHSLEPATVAPSSSAGPEHTTEVTSAVAEAPPNPTSSVAETTVLPVTQATEITLHVVTDPPGAKVSKGEFEACAATPCDIVVAQREGVDLEARLGSLRGRAKILAQQDQTVNIRLSSVGRPKPRMCEIDVNGLKILRPCAK